jgi:hypothetical protein
MMPESGGGSLEAATVSVLVHCKWIIKQNANDTDILHKDERKQGQANVKDSDVHPGDV